jgi:serine/threonine-protein kinase
VHDINFTPEGILYISMEFLEGEPLRDVVRRHRTEKRLPDIRYAVRIVDQMLAGLEYAHKYVIHRDIKPENVMVMSNERVKLLDFGLATAAVFDPPTEAQRSTPRKIVGTLEYSAPEQRMGEPMDLRADIYAVGLVFRELLTLRSPVEDPWHIEECRRDVAPAVLEVAYKALAADRDNRWQDARSFREALYNAYQSAYKRVAVRAAQSAGAQGSTKDMVLFAGGTFLMGSNASREEAPEEEVHVAPFWMDRAPVTVGQYAKYVKETGAQPPKFWGDPDFDGDDQPVIGVSWQDALAYAHWAGKSLPTEAQWEFAARGQENRRYPWGNYPPDRNRCNFDGNLGLPTFTQMHEEGATPEGLLDMAGNVYEWTLDPYAPYQYFRRDPKSAEKAPKRTARGGSWESHAEELTCTFRRGFFPDTQLKSLGFRCVIPVQEGE